MNLSTRIHCWVNLLKKLKQNLSSTKRRQAKKSEMIILS